MYVHNVAGTGSDTTSTTNMYHKDFTYRVEAGTAPVALVNAVQPIAGQPNKSFHART